ncbi:MAG: (d)CMP kinase, partial [Anaeroplasmataceae bacterium]|nr:(d)CMP kinase [Anaeroplasmataceae bacterium]
MAQEKETFVIVIDGMSASGKSTLALKLANALDANLIHMDDFFLPKELRTLNRYQEAGGNIHYERFKEEVVNHINENIT